MEFIDIQDPRWLAFLEDVPHDFYHLPAYVALMAIWECARPIAFWASKGGHQLLIPLLLSDIDMPSAPRETAGWRDVMSPYGYPCPLFSTGCDLGTAVALSRMFHQAAREIGIVSAFIRLHPLIQFPENPFWATGYLANHGDTVYEDLSLSKDEFWQRTRSSHRHDIRKLRKLGFHAEIDRWEFYEPFVSLYCRTMQRLNSRPFYRFSPEFFRRLRETLADCLHLCTVLSPRGDVAAAGLFTETCGLVQYSLSASDERFSKVAPTKMMIDFARSWAKTGGNRYLHLGGGIGAEKDRLFHFNAGFSPLRAKFHTYRTIISRDSYEQLAHDWRMRNPSGSLTGGYFPEYRTPATPDGGIDSASRATMIEFAGSQEPIGD